MSPAGTRVLNDLNLVGNINEFNYIKNIIDVKIQALQEKTKQGQGVGTTAQVQEPEQVPPNPAVSSPNPQATGNRATVDTGRFSASKKVKENIKGSTYYARDKRD